MAGTPMTMVVDPGEAGPDKPAKLLSEQAADLRKASSQASSAQAWQQIRPARRQSHDRHSAC